MPITRGRKKVSYRTKLRELFKYWGGGYIENVDNLMSHVRQIVEEDGKEELLEIFGEKEYEN